MLSAVYYNNHDIRVEERPKPKISAGEILLKIEACGICGSDVLEWYRIKKAPLVLGHEIVGEIVEVGQGVPHYKVGDRIFVSHHIPCNTCKYCLTGNHTACHTLHTTNVDPGGFSEFVRVPRLNVDRGVFRLPPEMSFEEATFIEPLGCVVRGQKIAKVRSGQTVFVLGCGISGLLHIALAKAKGAGKIIATDLHPYRLEKAKEFGADHVIAADQDVPSFIRSVNQNMLADVVIVCAGALPALEQGLQSVDAGGTVEFFATCPPGIRLSLPVSDFWQNTLKLVTSYAAAPYDLGLAITLIQAKRIPVKKMITHRFSLSDAPKGFQQVLQGGESMKVILFPHGLNAEKNE